MSEARETRSGADDFRRVIALNEASKALVARSFQVSLIALGAIVQSRRAGNQLRGFDEVSSQMRQWSRDLHAELEKLGVLSQAYLERTSLRVKQARLLGLLEAAARQSGSPSAARALERRQADQDRLDVTLRAAGRAVANLLGDIGQLGLMAVVLSRAAMIEAASGDEEQRLQLGQISREFYDNSQAVQEVLAAVTKLMTSGAGRR